VNDYPILVDCDGCLTDHNRVFLSRVNAAFGTSYAYEDISEFDYEKCIGKEAAAYLYQMWHSDDLYDDTEPEPGALEALEKMRELRRVVVVTSPMAGHVRSKYRWLRRYFERDDIYIGTDKTLIKGCVLVDDGPHNLAAFPGPAIVYDRPWNRKVREIPRAMDWSDVVKLAERMVG
jgi:5'(3')-deoxyribonucleotidase